MTPPNFEELADLFARLARGCDEAWVWDDVDYGVRTGDREIFLWADTLLPELEP